VHTVFPQTVLNVLRLNFVAGVSRLSGFDMVYFIGYYVLIFTARCNISLALFNIIPVYPLDGAKILSVFLRPNTALKMAASEKIYQLILMLLMFLGVVSWAITPVCSAIIYSLL
jgi:Zn-dependent protease